MDSSIRNRFSESVWMFNEGHIEGALVLLLTIVAAASRIDGAKREGVDLCDFNARGRDEKLFKQYLTNRKFFSVGMSNGTISSNEILYKGIRCELIHQANSSIAFDPTLEELIIIGDDGQLRFGSKLFPALASVVLNDKNLRPFLREWLSISGNLVEPIDPVNISRLQLAAFHSLEMEDCGAKDLLIEFIEAVQPERISTFSRDELNEFVVKELIGKSEDWLPYNYIPAGWNAVRWADHTAPAMWPTLRDKDYLFTEMGWRILQKLAKLYETKDAIVPFSHMSLPPREKKKWPNQCPPNFRAAFDRVTSYRNWGSAELYTAMAEELERLGVEPPDNLPTDSPREHSGRF